MLKLFIIEYDFRLHLLGLVKVVYLWVLDDDSCCCEVLLMSKVKVLLFDLIMWGSLMTVNDFFLVILKIFHLFMTLTMMLNIMMLVQNDFSLWALLAKIVWNLITDHNLLRIVQLRLNPLLNFRIVLVNFLIRILFVFIQPSHVDLGSFQPALDQNDD